LHKSHVCRRGANKNKHYYDTMTKKISTSRRLRDPERTSRSSACLPHDVRDDRKYLTFFPLFIFNYTTLGGEESSSVTSRKGLREGNLREHAIAERREFLIPCLRHEGQHRAI